MSVAINCVMFTFGRGLNKLALAQFQSDQDNHQVLITNVPFASINNFTSRLNDIVNAVENSDISKSLCDVLTLALSMIPITNNNNAKNYKKMAIMVTNCTLNLGDYFSTTSAELNRHRIKLYVVAIGTPVFEIWNRYRTLARCTGGEYMLLQRAPGILKRIVESTIYEEHELRQASQHMHRANVVLMPNHLDEMNEQNEITDGVGDLAFDHE